MKFLIYKPGKNDSASKTAIRIKSIAAIEETPGGVLVMVEGFKYYLEGEDYEKILGMLKEEA